MTAALADARRGTGADRGVMSDADDAAVTRTRPIDVALTVNGEPVTRRSSRGCCWCTSCATPSA